MATTSQNNQVYLPTNPTPYPIDVTGSFDINQGDLVWFDTSAKVVKPMTSDGNMATGAGVAGDQSYANLYGTKKYLPQLPVWTAGRYSFKTTSGDTYNHGDAVYAGVDAQTITNQAATNKIGYAWMKLGQSAVAGGAGVTIDILIAPLYPALGVL